jgi:hypothetical protein
VFNPEQRSFVAVNGKEMSTSLTKIFTGTALLAFLNRFSA